MSFGGASGVELADSCSNLSQLTAAYQSVINTLHVTHIDFDIEGALIAYTAQNNLRFQAINALEAANPGLVVSVTIPVNPTGPDNNGQAFLAAAKADGTRIDIINGMAMDYYGTFDSGGAEMGTDAVDAAQATLAYAKTLWPSMTYSMIGVTPMIGQNDDPAEVFTEADAHTLVSFAQSITTWAGWRSGRWTVTRRAAGRQRPAGMLRRSVSSRWTSPGSSSSIPAEGKRDNRQATLRRIPGIIPHARLEDMSTSLRCLVTGSSGYIGGRLVPELLAAGHRVRCMAGTLGS